MQLNEFSLLLFLTFLSMSPIMVAPEETQSSETDDPFYIPVATQARIYAALDSQIAQNQKKVVIDPVDKSSQNHWKLFQSKLSDWFPQGLLWTADDDDNDGEDSSSISDEDSSKQKQKTRSNKSKPPFVVQVESTTTTDIPLNNQSSFVDIMDSFEEGDRLLSQNFDTSSDDDSSLFDGDGEIIDNRLGLGDTRSKKENSYENQTRHRRRSRRSAHDKNYDADDSTLNDVNSLSSSISDLDDDNLCHGVPSAVPHRPGEVLQCYTCTSSTSDGDPQCDHRLWKYLRHSEKFNHRKSCGRGGFACMKKVSKKYGERLTERACVPLPLRVPSEEGITHAHFSYDAPPLPKDVPYKEINPEGCYTHSQKNGFLTTSCFCTSSLCNGAGRIRPSSTSGGYSLISFVSIFIALLLYGISFKVSED